MSSSYENQGTGYDPGAAGHERQGRASEGHVTETRFTLVFSGDLRKFAGNPFLTDTPFGRPVVASMGDATAEPSPMADERVDLLAQTMCAAFHADDPIPPNTITSPVWEGLSVFQRGNWRRSARAAMRTLEGNAHWITPAGLDAISGKGG